MTRIRLTPGVIDDLDRIVGHLQRHEIENADARAGEIISAFGALADSPRIGRPAGNDRRGLLIGHGFTSRRRHAQRLAVSSRPMLRSSSRNAGRAVMPYSTIESSTVSAVTDHKPCGLWCGLAPTSRLT